jgi:hypothetical protein
MNSVVSGIAELTTTSVSLPDERISKMRRSPSSVKTVTKGLPGATFQHRVRPSPHERDRRCLLRVKATTRSPLGCRSTCSVCGSRCVFRRTLKRSSLTEMDFGDSPINVTDICPSGLASSPTSTHLVWRLRTSVSFLQKSSTIASGSVISHISGVRGQASTGRLCHEGRRGGGRAWRQPPIVSGGDPEWPVTACNNVQ